MLKFISSPQSKINVTGSKQVFLLWNTSTALQCQESVLTILMNFDFHSVSRWYFQPSPHSLFKSTGSVHSRTCSKLENISFFLQNLFWLPVPLNFQYLIWTSLYLYKFSSASSLTTDTIQINKGVNSSSLDWHVGVKLSPSGDKS